MKVAEAALQNAEKERDALINGFDRAHVERERQIVEKRERASTLYQLMLRNRALERRKNYVEGRVSDRALAAARTRVEAEKKEKQDAMAADKPADKKRWVFRLRREPTREEEREWEQAWLPRWEANVSRGGRHNRDIRNAEATLADLEARRDPSGDKEFQRLLAKRQQLMTELGLTEEQARNVSAREINRLRAEADGLEAQRRGWEPPAELANANSKVATAKAALEVARSDLDRARELVEYEQQVSGYDDEALAHEVGRLEDELDSCDRAYRREFAAENRRLVDEMGTLKSREAKTDDEADSVAAHNLAVTQRRDEILQLIIQLKRGVPIAKRLQDLLAQRQALRDRLRTALERLIKRAEDALAQLRRESDHATPQLRTARNNLVNQITATRNAGRAVLRAWEDLRPDPHTVRLIGAWINLANALLTVTTGTGTGPIGDILGTGLKNNLSTLVAGAEEAVNFELRTHLEYRKYLPLWNELQAFVRECRALDGKATTAEQWERKVAIIAGEIPKVEATLREYRPKLAKLNQ